MQNFNTRPGDEDLGIGKRDISTMKLKPCAIDRKLQSNPTRRAPPINPKTCIEGSVSTGKYGDIYVINGGKWIKAEQLLDDSKKAQIRERLAERMAGTVKTMGSGKKATSPTPAKKRPGLPKGGVKKAASPTPAKKARGRPKGDGKKARVKTPARKRCPPGSRKTKYGKSCVAK